MRNITNWQVYPQGLQPTLLFGRGYTGHEHLNQFGLINMNARLYDPLLARFLAPDPLVASPETSNGFNRYMYASDNPMMYVDLNGEEGFPWDNPNHNGNNPNGNTNNTINPSNHSNNFYNPYSGPNQGSQGGNNGYTGGSGGYSGSTGGTGLGSLIITGIQYLYSLFSPHSDPSRFRPTAIGPSTPYFASAKPITLGKPAGTGASTVYAGGGSRRSGNGTNNNGSAAILSLVNATAAYVGGGMFDLGFVYDKTGDNKMYLTIGLSGGMGSTVGIGYTILNDKFRTNELAGEALGANFTVPYFKKLQFIGGEVFGDFVQGESFFPGKKVVGVGTNIGLGKGYFVNWTYTFLFPTPSTSIWCRPGSRH